MKAAATCFRVLAGSALLLFLGAGNSRAQQTDRLQWQPEENRVSASITGMEVTQLLEQISGITGWQIYLEPDTRHTVSTRFVNRTPGDALRLLLGNLSFALLPQTNGPSKLFVFRTTVQEATQLIQPPARQPDPTARPIPNELVVTLKAGGRIDEVARRLGAQIVGRADGLNTYRLSFESAAAAEAAREKLAAMEEVAAIDYNYWMRRPEPTDGLTFSSGFAFGLRSGARPDCQSPIVGLIDSAVQPLGPPFDQFVLPGVAVAGEAQLPANLPTHGTSMLETILRGLSVRDQQTGVKILPVDVYGNNSVTTTFDVAHGIVQAIDKGARILNLSLGTGGDSDFLRGVIRAGTQQGVLFLAAAGNEPTTTPTYPAAYAGVLAVTAGSRDGRIAPYANRGEFVDLVAPGSSIVHFNGQSWLVMGTSASTAFASGLAASLLDCQKTSPEQMAAAMQTLLPVRR